jgi:hypothetical protein
MVRKYSDHAPPSSTEAVNGWSNTSSPLQAFMVCTVLASSPLLSPNLYGKTEGILLQKRFLQVLIIYVLRGR